MNPVSVRCVAAVAYKWEVERRKILELFLDTGFASVPTPAGLVGWWRAENNAQDSAGANHGL
jgi:hypothetical protein